MAIHRSLGKITTPLSHLPTWFFIIGYPLFWIDLYTHDAGHGVSSALSWVLFGSVALLSLFGTAGDLQNQAKRLILFWYSLDRLGKLFWSVGFSIALLIIGIVLLASLKPIHLIQEFDCLQYHYTLPRQHLIAGSFAHIPWAADDLFLLPMDFALAPFWFATVLPNKIPQFIIFLGLISVAMRLTSALATGRRPWAVPLVALLILGTHGFGIQMGTGMLDLAIAYLFLASLDSLRLGKWFLAGVEFTFFFWSKPLMPLETVMTIGIWAFILVLARRSHWQMADTFTFKHVRRVLGVFLILSVMVAGPFIAKSIYYAGTPFYPLAPGPQASQGLHKASQLWMGSKNTYGHGKDLGSFIKHWWLLAVPENGVNNSFDYPLGLTYLLMIGPFLYFLIKDILRRRFCPLSILVGVIWMLWWFGPQQTRFLYLPLLIIFIVTIARLEKISRGLFLGVLISLFFELISLWGAHKGDMARWGVNDLRVQDQQLLEINHRYIDHSLSNDIVWPSHDVAYAQFPVVVHKENLPHTILF
jgi:hypothetical protein